MGDFVKPKKARHTHSKAGAAQPSKRVPLSLRVTPQVKALLDAASAKSGRSQTQEIEFRLERSFDRDGMLPEVLSRAYGGQLAGLLMVLGEVLTSTIAIATARTRATADTTKDKEFILIAQGYRDGNLSHPFVFAEVIDATMAVLGFLDPAEKRPAGEIPDEQYAAIAGSLSPEDMASAILHDVLDTPKTERSWASEAGQLLGDLGAEFLKRKTP